MSPRILIAGLGNIFQGDDAFGVIVAQRFGAVPPAENVRVMDVGIRSIDLAFALLDDYELTILVDATSRGCAPGTLYTIEIDPDEVPDACVGAGVLNSHGLDPWRMLSLAKSMGARFGKLLLIGCEPLVLNCDETGHIGLSNVVEAVVNPAVDRIRRIIREFGFEKSDRRQQKEEVFS
jgi:hydrogenase maturation protease